MKFNIKYSKFSNLFFFASNLSEWSQYCRKEYNGLWLKESPLSEKEISLLNKLKEILKKYKISNLILSSLTEDEALEKIKDIINSEDILIIKECLGVLEKRFGNLWKEEEKNLFLIKQEIEKTLDVSKKIFDDIQTLYGIKQMPQSIDIFLFTNPIVKRSVNGGGGLGENQISIECSKITGENNKNKMLERVMIHEIVHVSFESKLKEKIKEFLKSNRFSDEYEDKIIKTSVFHQANSIIGTLKEMILVSLIPEGYLAEKFFDLNVLDNLRERKCIKERTLEKNYYDLMLYAVYKLYPFAKKYCENKKEIYNDFIENAVKCWLEFEEIDLSKLKI
ncbi:MAG: hypothetical protein ABIJ28_02010 [Patescibacteria group bacterium]